MQRLVHRYLHSRIRQEPRNKPTCLSFAAAGFITTPEGHERRQDFSSSTGAFAPLREKRFSDLLFSKILEDLG
jgi:hypothetical protein